LTGSDPVRARPGKGCKNMNKIKIRQYLNRGISTPVAVFVILIFLLIVGAAILWEVKIGCPSSGLPSPSPTPLSNEFITVTSLVIDQEIESPVLVQGESNTFEANVRIRIKDDNGNVLADTFTMGGAYGEMKPFSMEVVYDSPSVPTGVVGVFENSAKDGSEINRITVPVIFQDYSDQTADWKIYRNEEYGFEIHYPKSFQVVEQENLIQIVSPSILCETGVFGPETEKIKVSESNLTFALHPDSDYDHIWEEVFGFSATQFDGVKEIDGKKAQFFFQGAEMVVARTAYLVEKTATSAIEINTYNPVLIFNCEKDIDQFGKLNDKILSTFKFID